MLEGKTVDEKVDYLHSCLPLKQFNNITSDVEEYTEETVDDLIQEGKEALKLEMQQGSEHWEYIKESENTDVVSDSDLFEKSYRELAYYAVAMGNSGLETTPLPFEYNREREVGQLIEDDQHTIDQLIDVIIENGGEDIEAAFSKVGRNIWEVIGDEPEIRLAYFENKNHLYLEFWAKARDEREFDKRRGEFVEWPEIRTLDCRIHLDDCFIELRGRNERQRDRRRVLEYAEGIFGNTRAIQITEEDLEITDTTIREFMNLPEFIANPHSSKTGAAKSNWTSDSDVRDDPEYPDHRPHNYGNLVFNLPSVGRVSFQLSADTESFRIFQHKITPREYIQLVEYIWENINDANN